MHPYRLDQLCGHRWNKPLAAGTTPTCLHWRSHPGRVETHDHSRTFWMCCKGGPTPPRWSGGAAQDRILLQAAHRQCPGPLN